MKAFGFLSFGHYASDPRQGPDAKSMLKDALEIARGADELGVNGAYFRVHHFARQAAALGTTDTASIVIFQAFKRDTRYGYASALAILLLIIILAITAINNRIASRRVFYG